jgi:hypothetical protein
MKKVNLNVPLTELDGTQVLQEGKQVMLKTIVANKIAATQHESDFEKTLHRFELAKKIVRSDSAIEIDEEDIVFIRSTMSNLSVIAAGQIFQALK